MGVFEENVFLFFRFAFLACFVYFEDFFHVLFATTVMFVSRPIGIKFVSNLAVAFFLVGLPDERVLEEFGPG